MTLCQFTNEELDNNYDNMTSVQFTLKDLQANYEYASKYRNYVGLKGGNRRFPLTRGQCIEGSCLRI